MSENEVASPAPVVSSGSPPGAKSRSVFWIVLLVLLCFVGPPTLFGIAGVFWYSTARVAMDREQKRAVEAVQAEVRMLEAVKRAELESKHPVPTTNSAMGSGMGAAPGMGSGMAPGMMSGSSGAATVENMSPLDDPRVNMIRVELQFGKFGVTTVDALVVDRVNDNEVVYVAPARPLQPRRGKVNGREVVERPVLVLRDSRIPEHMPGMPGGMGGMPGMGGIGVGMSEMGRGGSVILSRDRAPSEAPDTGVCVFRGFSTAQPIQLLGDLPEASVGDQVSIVSAEGKLDIGESKITAVGVDVEAQADRPRVSKAIQLDFPSYDGVAAPIPNSRTNIPLGALLVNARNQPVGMVVRIDGGPATVGNPANNALVVYATPIAQVFTAAADWAVTPPVSEPSSSNAENSPPAYVPGEKSPPVAESSDESDEEWRKLEAEAQALAKQASQAMGDERTMLLEKLTTIVGRQFERRQQLRKLRIDELEQRLGKLREEHQTREQAKTEEVQKRIETMVPPPPAAQKP